VHTVRSCLARVVAVVLNRLLKKPLATTHFCCLAVRNKQAKHECKFKSKLGTGCKIKKSLIFSRGQNQLILSKIKDFYESITGL
jgi:hypothetical protein